jgi:hypothetical protein
MMLKWRLVQLMQVCCLGYFYAGGKIAGLC